MDNLKTKYFLKKKKNYCHSYLNSTDSFKFKNYNSIEVNSTH